MGFEDVQVESDLQSGPMKIVSSSSMLCIRLQRRSEIGLREVGVTTSGTRTGKDK